MSGFRSSALLRVATRKQPNLFDIRGLGPSQCGRGYLTYAIAADTSPLSVIYEPGPFRTYEWKLTGP